jgi:predicted PilT family ATPase
MVRASLTLYLPDEDAGAILGRKGQNLAEIQRTARVTVKISDRTNMENNEREVTISGPYGESLHHLSFCGNQLADSCVHSPACCRLCEARGGDGY